MNFKGTPCNKNWASSNMKSVLLQSPSKYGKNVKLGKILQNIGNKVKYKCTSAFHPRCGGILCGVFWVSKRDDMWSVVKSCVLNFISYVLEV